MIKNQSITENMKIISNKEIAASIYEMILEGNIANLIKNSGQFLHLQMPSKDLLLRRPISIAAYNNNQCTLLYRVVGSGTEEMSKLVSGNEINVLGPLGNGFNISNLQANSDILIVGGGIGVAPLYQLAVDLHAAGHKVTSILGFANKDDIYYADEFSKVSEVIITTDDGSAGLHGHVGVGINNLTADSVYACGPTPLLKHVQNNFESLDNVYLSLEEKMACGIGACYACDTKKKDKRTCKDGPVFNAKEVEL